jgi:uncharacterized membrane protein YjjP (DUF1212 family)
MRGDCEGRDAAAPNPAAVDLTSQERRRFIAALVFGQLAALFGLLVFGGVLMPMLAAFAGSAAGVFVVAEPRRPAARR